MTRKELAAILSKVAPTTYNEWAGKQGVPKPPFIAYLDDDPDIHAADNGAHIIKYRYRIELYVPKGDDTTEDTLDAALKEAEIFFIKYAREWLKDEEWYLTVYEI
jgi:hypothetical protein